MTSCAGVAELDLVGPAYEIEKFKAEFGPEPLIELRCPPGSTDGLISHDAVSFVPYRADGHHSEWRVTVPATVARYLRLGGFTPV